jgi:hypothetical protein
MKAADDELKTVASELASLEHVAAERKARIDAGLAKARALVACERDAVEAFHQAERHEREVEAEYDA